MTRPRGECPECGYSIRLNKSGKIGYHSYRAFGKEASAVCNGSLLRPVAS